MSSIDPSQTLYIKNIKGRVNLEELKASLYNLFSTYGPILDITAKKTYKMREQAFVVYTNVAAATTAMRGLNGFAFFGGPLKIEYAKTKSDAIAKLDGTFKLRTSNKSGEVSTLGKRSAEEEDSAPSKMARTEESDEESDDHA